MTLNALKAYATRYLTDTCTIEKEARVFDEYGGRNAAGWTMVASGVACRIYRPTSLSQAQTFDAGAQEAIKEMYKVALPIGTDVSVDYQLTLNGEKFQVVAIEAEMTDQFFTQVIVTRRR